MHDQSFRSHPRSILSQSAKGLGAASAFLLFQVDDIIRFLKRIFFDKEYIDVRTILIEIGFFAGFALLIALFGSFNNWRIWKKRSFILDGDTFLVKDERLTNRQLSFYIKDLSNITVSQSILERLLGLSRLTLNTNTGATASTDDVWVIEKTDFIDDLAETLRKRKTGAARITNASPEEATTADWIVSQRRDILRHLVYQTQWLTFLISGLFFAWGLLALIGIYVIQAPLPVTPFNEDDLSAGFWAVIPLLGFLAPIVTSYARAYIQVYDFRIRRVRDELEIEQGLFTRKKSRIPIKRIHALYMEQGVIERVADYAHVKMVNIGADNEDHEEPMVLLTMSLSEVHRTLNSLLPEFHWPNDWMHQPKAALVPLWGIRVPVALTILIGGTIALPGYWGALMLPLWLLFPIYLYLLWRTPGIALSGDHMALRNGVFDARTILMRFQDIEQMSIHRPFLARMAKVGYGSFFYLSGKLLSGSESSDYYQAGLFDEVEDRLMIH